jgi:L-arabinose transport system substrate-binding protein
LQFDANLALTAMDTVIGAGVDGILIVVPEQQIGPAVMQKAADAGIPLMTVDDVIKDANGVFAPHVGFSPADMGKLVAQTANGFYNAEGWGSDPAIVANTRIVAFEDQTLTVCMDRTNAANATWLEQYPDWHGREPHPPTLR